VPLPVDENPVVVPRGMGLGLLRTRSLSSGPGISNREAHGGGPRGGIVAARNMNREGGCVSDGLQRTGPAVVALSQASRPRVEAESSGPARTAGRPGEIGSHERVRWCRKRDSPINPVWRSSCGPYSDCVVAGKGVRGARPVVSGIVGHKIWPLGD